MVKKTINMLHCFYFEMNFYCYYFLPIYYFIESIVGSQLLVFENKIKYVDILKQEVILLHWSIKVVCC